MKIQLIGENRKVEIEANCENSDINGYWNDLIKPALVAWGFTEKTVDELTGEE